MAIIITQKGVPSASVVEKSGFEQERNLQEYIHEHPEAIPVYDIRPMTRFPIVALESETRSGPIDALRRQGRATFTVETKLYTNSDKRRVVAQVLDYGASLWKHLSDFETFLSALDQHVRRKWGTDFWDKAREFLISMTKAPIPCARPCFRTSVNGNLKSLSLWTRWRRGSKISSRKELKEPVRYLRRGTGIYKHSDYEILIPKIFGVEVKKDNPRPDRPSLDKGTVARKKV